MKNFYNSLMLLSSRRSQRGAPLRLLRHYACCLTILCLTLFSAGISFAQSPVISYPSIAEPLTRGLGSSLLTVKVSFPAACENISVEIDLPDGVSYVSGSVVKTQGVGSQTITADGGTVNRPKFAISTATAGNDIEFTIARIANCGTGNGKDEVYITSSCGNVSETVANVNNYSVFAGALSMTAPDPIANASVGSNYSRTFTVTNGGNGCLDTLRLYVVRPAGSIGSPVIAIGATTIPAARANGDTTFYKVFGVNLPSGDNQMCNGETITFTESFTLINCLNLTTTYGSSWGRNVNNLCQTVNVTGLVNMNTANPNIVYSFSGASVQGCSFLPRTITMTMTNSGQAPASNIKAMVGNVYAGAYFNYSYYLDTASFAVTLPGSIPFDPQMVVENKIVNSNNSPACALGEVGMASFDLPSGFVLGVGQSILVTFQLRTCATTDCAGVYDPGNMAARINFKNQCGTSDYTTGFGYSSFVPGVQLGGGFQTELPAQVFAGNCFKYTITGTAAITPGNAYPNSYYEYNITLPEGVTWTNETGSLVENLHGDVPTLITQNADVLTIRYHTTEQYHSHEIELTLCVAADACGDLSLPTEFKTTPNSTCTNPVFLNRCSEPKIYSVCTDPCPTGGATPTSWNHQRITFGVPDTDNDGKPDVSGTLDMELVKRTHYFPGDVMSSYVASVISSNTVEVPNYTTWPFVYSEWSFSAAQWQPEGTATVLIKRGGTILHTLTGITPSVLTAGTKFKADWSSQLPGFVYEAGDSVIVMANFKLGVTSATATGNTTYTPFHNLGLVSGTLSQTVYASQTANPAEGSLEGPNRFSCFTPQYNFYTKGAQHTVSYNQIGSAGGCSEMTVGGSLYTYLGGSILASRFFPYEHRPLIMPDTVIFNVPAGWDFVAHSNAYFQYNIRGGDYNNQTITVTPTVTGNSTTGLRVAYDLKSLFGTSAFPFLPTEGNQAFITFRVKPSCQTPLTANSSMMEKGHFTYYPSESSPFYYSITAGNTLTYPLANRPALAIQDNTGVVAGVTQQHHWDVQVNTGVREAPYVWLSIEKGTSGITIDRVELLPSGTVLTPNSFGSSDLWYQFATSITGGSNQAARIYFKYSNCTLDSIKITTGWNCSGYPPTNPSAVTSCSADELYLKVRPEPSQVQLSMAKQPVAPTLDLCEEDYVEAVVNSALGANVDNPEITIIPPVGLNVVLPFQVEYPIGSGTWQDVTATNNSGQYIVNLEEHAGIGLDGLPGTLTNPDSSGRLAKIRVRYDATCDFVSGSRVGFIVGGDRPCGGIVSGDGDYINSAPINITGVEVTGTAGLALNMANITLTCSTPETINLQVTPTGSPTIAGDVAVYTLPAGLAYVNETFAPGSNCTGCTIAVTSGTGGSTVLTVSLPENVLAGTNIQFAVGIRAVNVENGCGNKTITGEMQRLVGGLSCGSVECEVSKAVIGNTSQVVSILKPQLDVSSIALTKSGDQVNYSIVVNNNGTVASEVGYQLKVYCGPISNDNVVETVSTRAIAAGGTDTYTGTYDITLCSSGSDMFAQIDELMASSTIACNCGTPAVASTEAPLPVTLLSFKAIAEGQTAVLNWVTVAETNSDRFEVEQSLNGKVWNKVGTVPAKGNSVVNVAYTFTDANPDNGQNLYRLRVVDRDGKFGLSTIVGLNFQVDAVKLFPSPVSDKLTMRAQDWDKVSDVEMYDSNGKVVYESHRGSSGKLLAQEINVKPFSSGVYMVRISRKNGVVTIHKIVVNR